MSEEFFRTDLVLRSEARQRFYDIENIQRTLQEIRRHPAEFRTRVAELETAVSVINSLLRSTHLDPNTYQHVIELRQLLGKDESIHNMVELVGMYREGLVQTDFSQTPVLLDRAFDEVHSRVVGGKWPFATETGNPFKLAAGLLIEGYGLFSEIFRGKPDMARTTVLAIEEVLIANMPQSQLLKDVLGWIKEERDDFPPVIRTRIDRL